MSAQARGPATTIGTGIDPGILLQQPQHTKGTAIVLSGGSAKGDFEVGAVRCLYNRGVRPKILCGTSVGSVNALKLAEGEDTLRRARRPQAMCAASRGLKKSGCSSLRIRICGNSNLALPPYSTVWRTCRRKWRKSRQRQGPSAPLRSAASSLRSLGFPALFPSRRNFRT